MTGHMLAFDKHMNLVLSDCEEFRRIKPKTSSSGTVAQERERKRTLGLIILRGETIVSMSVDAPPHPALEGQQARLPQAYTGTGMAVPAGCGLTGPVRGVGGPDPTMMLPYGPAAVAPPLPFGRGMPLGTIPSPGFILPPGVPPAGFHPMGMDLPHPGPPPPSVVPQPGANLDFRHLDFDESVSPVHLQLVFQHLVLCQLDSVQAYLRLLSLKVSVQAHHLRDFKPHVLASVPHLPVSALLNEVASSALSGAPSCKTLANTRLHISKSQ
ncbi:hypothetical protein BGZ91_000247 [Linnemannia elongata]|nr:hypothetical protein BGZ91_000247 [Linnemannia elongata]